jgi:hypothetical protein
VEALESRAGNLPGDQVMVLADAPGRRLAGNLPASPPDMPSLPERMGGPTGRSGGRPRRIAAASIGFAQNRRVKVMP